MTKSEATDWKTEGLRAAADLGHRLGGTTVAEAKGQSKIRLLLIQKRAGYYAFRPSGNKGAVWGEWAVAFWLLPSFCPASLGAVVKHVTTLILLLPSDSWYHARVR